MINAFRQTPSLETARELVRLAVERPLALFGFAASRADKALVRALEARIEGIAGHDYSEVSASDMALLESLFAAPAVVEAPVPDPIPAPELVDALPAPFQSEEAVFLGASASSPARILVRKDARSAPLARIIEHERAHAFIWAFLHSAQGFERSPLELELGRLLAAAQKVLNGLPDPGALELRPECCLAECRAALKFEREGRAGAFCDPIFLENPGVREVGARFLAIFP